MGNRATPASMIICCCWSELTGDDATYSSRPAITSMAGCSVPMDKTLYSRRILTISGGGNRGGWVWRQNLTTGARRCIAHADSPFETGPSCRLRINSCFGTAMSARLPAQLVGDGRIMAMGCAGAEPWSVNNAYGFGWMGIRIAFGGCRGAATDWGTPAPAGPSR